jgi:hypothetical protein
MNKIHRQAKQRMMPMQPSGHIGRMQDECAQAGTSCDMSQARERSRAQDPEQHVTGDNTDLAGPQQVLFWFPLRPPKPMSVEALRLFAKLETQRRKKEGE